MNLNYFRNYWLRKTCFLKCLKVPVSEHPLAIDVLMGPKQCWNLHDSTFTLLFHHSEINSVENTTYSDQKSYDCLLTHWMPMTSILVMTGRTSCKPCKFNYLKIEKLLMKFSLSFWNINKILNILKKKMSLIA